ncbi:unnamed protein product, partial [Rotaria sp. Silwood1]
MRMNTYNMGNKEYNYYYATKEIILSGGAFDTPKLLLLSGIGPCDGLKYFNITCLSHVPGVGKNLEDHSFTSLWSPPSLDQNTQLPSYVLGGWGVAAYEEN